MSRSVSWCTMSRLCRSSATISARSSNSLRRRVGGGATKSSPRTPANGCELTVTTAEVLGGRRRKIGGRRGEDARSGLTPPAPMTDDYQRLNASRRYVTRQARRTLAERLLTWSAEHYFGDRLRCSDCQRSRTKL